MLQLQYLGRFHATCAQVNSPKVAVIANTNIVLFIDFTALDKGEALELEVSLDSEVMSGETR